MSVLTAVGHQAGMAHALPPALLAEKTSHLACCLTSTSHLSALFSSGCPWAVAASRTGILMQLSPMWHQYSKCFRLHQVASVKHSPGCPLLCLASASSPQRVYWVRQSVSIQNTWLNQCNMCHLRTACRLTILQHLRMSM